MFIANVCSGVPKGVQVRVNPPFIPFSFFIENNLVELLLWSLYFSIVFSISNNYKYSQYRLQSTSYTTNTDA